jgi:hypothetical protein
MDTKAASHSAYTPLFAEHEPSHLGANRLVDHGCPVAVKVSSFRAEPKAETIPKKRRVSISERKDRAA